MFYYRIFQLSLLKYNTKPENFALKNLSLLKKFLDNISLLYYNFNRIEKIKIVKNLKSKIIFSKINSKSFIFFREYGGMADTQA